MLKKNILMIDRSRPFNPAISVGRTWQIDEEGQDKRSLALTEIDLDQITLETCLKPRELRITGEERLSRLKMSGKIRLDAGVFQAFQENKHSIPGAWKRRINGRACFVCFDGTPLWSPGTGRCTLFLFWCDDAWRWDYFWLNSDFPANYPSAVYSG